MSATPLASLELAITETNGLTIADAQKAKLLEVLKPIADGIAATLATADRVAVVDKASADHAAALRDAILADAKTAETALRDFDNGLIDRLHKTHRAWTALLSAFKSPLEDAAKLVKGKVITWQEAEAEKARAEQARLQAEADERARKLKEQLEREAAKLKSPEKKQERLEAAAAVVAPVVHVAAPVAAVKTQRRWFVAGVDKAAIIKAAAADSLGILNGFLEINATALQRAKSANPELQVPGVTFEQRAI